MRVGCVPAPHYLGLFQLVLGSVVILWALLGGLVRVVRCHGGKTHRFAKSPIAPRAVGNGQFCRLVTAVIFR